MNIFKFEINKQWFSTLIWGIGIIFGILLYIAFFPTMAEDPETMTTIMKNFPDEFLAFFGINGDLPFNSVLGYYALTMQFVCIAYAIHAVYLGLSILSVEERELTADFLLSKPISRQKIFLNKLLASLTHVFILWIIICGGSLISLTLFRAGQTIDYSAMMTYLFSILLFQLSFFSIGLLASLIIPKLDNVIVYAVGIGFGFFIINSLGEMLSMHWVNFLSPFGHFNSNDIIVYGFDVWLTLINVLITVSCITGAYILYQNKDIHSV